MAIREKQGTRVERAPGCGSICADAVHSYESTSQTEKRHCKSDGSSRCRDRKLDPEPVPLFDAPEQYHSGGSAQTRPGANANLQGAARRKEIACVETCVNCGDDRGGGHGCSCNSPPKRVHLDRTSAAIRSTLKSNVCFFLSMRPSAAQGTTDGSHCRSYSPRRHCRGRWQICFELVLRSTMPSVLRGRHVFRAFRMRVFSVELVLALRTNWFTVSYLRSSPKAKEFCRSPQRLFFFCVGADDGTR